MRLNSSSEFEFLSSTDPSEAGLSEHEIRKRTDPELMAPIPGPDSQLQEVKNLWGASACESLDKIVNEFELQRSAGLFRPVGTHACVHATLVILDPGIRLWIIRGRRPVPAPTQWIYKATANCRFDAGRGGRLCGRHSSCVGPHLWRYRRMPIPHQASGHRRSSAYDVLLHVSPRTPLIGLPTSGARRVEWRDAAWVHHLEIGKAIGRKSDGAFARPYKEGMPSAARVWPHQLVLSTPQPGRSPLPIPLESGLYSKGNSRQH